MNNIWKPGRITVKYVETNPALTLPLISSNKINNEDVLWPCHATLFKISWQAQSSLCRRLPDLLQVSASGVRLLTPPTTSPPKTLCHPCPTTFPLIVFAAPQAFNHPFHGASLLHFLLPFPFLLLIPALSATQKVVHSTVDLPHRNPWIRNAFRNVFAVLALVVTHQYALVTGRESPR